MGDRFQIHASAAAINGRAVMFFGPSGSGKSSAALSLMAHGAALISDDIVAVTAGARSLQVAAPPGAPARIEARGVGLLAASLVPGAYPLALAIDLARAEPDRLPPERALVHGRVSAPLILAHGHPNLAPMVLQFLSHGRAT
ncbi:MAG: serine kinase [Pseudomonadota bacterium]